MQSNQSFDIALGLQRSLSTPWRRDVWIVALALLFLLVWDSTSLDLSLVRLSGNAAGFALRDHWLTSQVLHQGGRTLAWGVALLLLIHALRPQSRLWREQSRRERWVWLASSVFCVVLIPILKRNSATSCPWDLAEFGGVAHYVSHWRFGVPDGGPGRCFPSGHASSAFAFFSGYFALRRAYPGAAKAWLAGVLIAGLLAGWAQMARGAHYPSHTLWTAWVCWTACAVGARLLLPHPVPRRPDQG